MAPEAALQRRNASVFEHFKGEYGDEHGLPPYWILVNIMDFGMMLTLFRAAPEEVKKGIAEEIGAPVEVLDSWLLTLNTTRNICAHHDRLWNRRLGNRTKIPRKPRYPEWHTPYEVNNSTTFTFVKEEERGQYHAHGVCEHRPQRSSRRGAEKRISRSCCAAVRREGLPRFPNRI